MILSAVDFRISWNEDRIIRDYLAHEFPFRVNLDKEMDVISNLRPDEWEAHFRKVMDDFYDDATSDERNRLLKFAIELAKGDHVISKKTTTLIYYSRIGNLLSATKHEA